MLFQVPLMIKNQIHNFIMGQSKLMDKHIKLYIWRKYNECINKNIINYCIKFHNMI